jgi:hypothetical protein
MDLHEKMHDQHRIDEMFLYKRKSGGNTGDYDSPLTLAMEKISDPFEFQDWCINNEYEEYL